VSTPAHAVIFKIRPRNAPALPQWSRATKSAQASLKVSGPLLDPLRVDIHVEVPRVPYEKLTGERLGEPSSVVAARVEAARERQRKRFVSRGRLRAFGVAGSDETAPAHPSATLRASSGRGDSPLAGREDKSERHRLIAVSPPRKHSQQRLVRLHYGCFACDSAPTGQKHNSFEAGLQGAKSRLRP